MLNYLRNHYENLQGLGVTNGNLKEVNNGPGNAVCDYEWKMIKIVNDVLENVKHNSGVQRIDNLSLRFSYTVGRKRYFET